MIKNTTPEPTQFDNNHVTSVRSMLIEQMRAVRTATTAEALKMEVDKSRSISTLANAVTEMARVEADYAKTSGVSLVPFLESESTQATGMSNTHATPTGLVHRIR